VTPPAENRLCVVCRRVFVRPHGGAWTCSEECAAKLRVKALELDRVEEDEAPLELGPSEAEKARRAFLSGLEEEQPEEALDWEGGLRAALKSIEAALEVPDPGLVAWAVELAQAHLERVLVLVGGEVAPEERRVE
jgi:hypothetical protein